MRLTLDPPLHGLCSLRRKSRRWLIKASNLSKSWRIICSRLWHSMASGPNASWRMSCSRLWRSKGSSDSTCRRISTNKVSSSSSIRACASVLAGSDALAPTTLACSDIATSVAAAAASVGKSVPAIHGPLRPSAAAGAGASACEMPSRARVQERHHGRVNL